MGMLLVGLFCFGLLLGYLQTHIIRLAIVITALFIVFIVSLIAMNTSISTIVMDTFLGVLAIQAGFVISLVLQSLYQQDQKHHAEHELQFVPMQLGKQKR